MKIPENIEFTEIVCNATNNKGYICNKLLGYFQINTKKHYSAYYCKDCKNIHIVWNDEFGVLLRDVVNNKRKISCCSTIAIME